MESNSNSPNGPDHAQLNACLQLAAQKEASDVHLAVGYPITFRIHGQLVPVNESLLESDLIFQMIQSILPPRLQPKLAEGKNFDFSVAIEHAGHACRFRANIYIAQGQWHACLRHVPDAIPSFEWMGFPQGLAQKLISHTNGLVIVTGVTGSGKSTTLAALIQLLNQQGSNRILTIEEPIEYEYARIGTSIVTQREVGRDVDSFHDGLKYGLRQDPDVILVGEIRDRETAQMVLSASETGHLIFTTLHTRDAKGAVTRFVDMFPHDAQDDVRSQLALSLRSIVSQHLLPSAVEGKKRALAMEVMHVNLPVRIGINFGKIDSIESAIQTGKRDGMWTLDDDLQRLLDTGKITLATARKFAKDTDAIEARN